MVKSSLFKFTIENLRSQIELQMRCFSQQEVKTSNNLQFIHQNSGLANSNRKLNKIQYLKLIKTRKLTTQYEAGKTEKWSKRRMRNNLKVEIEIDPVDSIAIIGRLE